MRTSHFNKNSINRKKKIKKIKEIEKIKTKTMPPSNS
jgi:hypothetical protein